MQVLVDGALGVTEAERTEWVAAQCADDKELRSRVEDLVAAFSEADSPFEHAIEGAVAHAAV